MIIFVLIILVGVGMTAFYVWKTGLLKKEHLDEIKDYLDEIEARNEKIKQHEETILKKKKLIEKAAKKIVKLNNDSISLKEKISSTINEYNLKIDDLSMQLEIKDKLLIKESKKTIDLEKKLREKESKRIASVGTINSKERKIKNLEEKIIKLNESHKKELNKKDEIINDLKKIKKIPTMEDLKIYDYQYKEVERRQKNEE